jgi:hypothetical protein
MLFALPLLLLDTKLFPFVLDLLVVELSARFSPFTEPLQFSAVEPNPIISAPVHNHAASGSEIDPIHHLSTNRALAVADLLLGPESVLLQIFQLFEIDVVDIAHRAVQYSFKFSGIKEQPQTFGAPFYVVFPVARGDIDCLKSSVAGWAYPFTPRFFYGIWVDPFQVDIIERSAIGAPGAVARKRGGTTAASGHYSCSRIKGL